MDAEVEVALRRLLALQMDIALLLNKVATGDRVTAQERQDLQQKFLRAKQWIDNIEGDPDDATNL